MAMFLLKTEPGEFSYQDLHGRGRCAWDGVANPAALGHIRAMRRGDLALIYHTADQKRVVGAARAVSDPYPDPAKPGVNSRGQIATPVIDLEPAGLAPEPLTLAAMKADARFEGFVLLRQARLSAMPVPAELGRLILTLTGLSGVIG
ncbi:MAG: EVE domain-containing protein [Planctomyces sp.]|nr:EVE domain-containing protein [Planctomyces sp.]MBA4039126.1 EVE domain-containing protein [Planctomyces sp.]MBA4119911.1 EVE domain-containing protein [Isosphaera sp.]